MIFDIESHIERWKKKFENKLSKEDMDELESHLRDNIDCLLIKNKTPAEAFEKASSDLGNIDEIIDQYKIFYEEIFMELEKQINDNINSPEVLEQLYHKNPYAFKKCIENISKNDDSMTMTIRTWKARLSYNFSNVKNNENIKNLILIFILSIIAGVISIIPLLFDIKFKLNEFIYDESFYIKNFSFIIIPAIMIYFCFKIKMDIKKIILSFSIVLISIVFINFLPANDPYHTKILSIIHMPFFLWVITGFIFSGKNWKDPISWTGYLKYSGEFFIFSVLLYLGYAVLIFFSVSLFDSIKIDINDIVNTIGISGLFAIPVIGAYLSDTKREIVNNISPILARIFSPLFLIILMIFICVMLFGGKNPYNDRDFLVIFNFMLILVLGLVFYVITERKIDEKKNIFDFINILLIFSSIVINVIALSAIIVRLYIWGFSANKTAILFENLILMVNLGGLIFYYIKFILNKTGFINVENFVSKYLSVYFVWFVIVIFIFPFVFGFK